MNDIQRRAIGFGSLNVLLTAANAYKRISQDKEGLDLAGDEATVSIVFSAASIEAFVNDITLAINHPAYQADDQFQLLGYLLSEYEDSKMQINKKVEMMYFVLNGHKIDRGSHIYQDFSLLIKMRNYLLHRKPDDSILVCDQNEFHLIENNMFSALKSKNLVYLERPTHISTAIRTKACARWSCEVATRTTFWLHNMLPDSKFKTHSYGLVPTIEL